MSESTRKFATDRSRRFRAGNLSARDEKTISNVETYGCEVIQVKKSGAGQGWSYTLGVFDTCEQPDLIVVGLIDKTAHVLLNNAAKALRNGIKLTEGRHRDLIGDVECEFRPVDPKWVRHLMGWAVWYYGGEGFPVIQAVYPDRKNVFPEESGFDGYFSQPLMQSGAPMTPIENDFWLSADPDSSFFDWKFPVPPHTQAYLSNSVHAGTESVVYVSRDLSDGAWQFLGDSMSDGGGPVLSCLYHRLTMIQA